MAKSLKDKFDSLRNRFLIDDAEYRSMCKKLDKHDSELLDKVAQILKSKPYWDDEHNFQAIPIDYIDEVIAEMKAEVEK